MAAHPGMFEFSSYASTRLVNFVLLISFVYVGEQMAPQREWHQVSEEEKEQSVI